MFLAVKLTTKKRMFFSKKVYLRQFKDFYFTEIVFSYPKNKRQKRKMYNFLSLLNGPFIYNSTFSDNFSKIKEYSNKIFLKQVIISAFLCFCKIAQPESCTVFPFENLSEAFYFTLSKYTKKIVILNKEPDFDLCNKILEYSGTPVLFSLNHSNSSVLLNLSDIDIVGYFDKTFDKKLFDKHKNLFDFTQNTLNTYPALSFYSAIYEKFNRPELIDFCAEKIIKNTHALC